MRDQGKTRFKSFYQKYAHEEGHSSTSSIPIYVRSIQEDVSAKPVLPPSTQATAATC